MACQYQVRLVLFLIATASCLYSCDHSDISDKKAKYIATLECRAIALREQRFALADSIRFTQDTLLKKNVSIDTTRLNDKLHFFLQKKEELLQNSLLLADSIHQQLDSLRRSVFTNPDDKKSFDEKLERLIKTNGCNK